MVKHVMVCATLIIGLAVQAQAQAITTPLYPEENVAIVVVEDFVIAAPSTWYVFFQALSTVRVTALSVFGEPVEVHPFAAAYRWWLMETTSDWQTPNGNKDSLFYTGDVHFEDVGLSEYRTDIEEATSQIFYSDVLKAGSYYRLSFQVTNTDFQIPALDSLSFTTSDGLLSILSGEGFPFPGGARGLYPQFSITTAPVSIPIDIDIKPGGDPNSIDPKSKEAIPVAILTTDTFDATTIDPLSVQFGPNGATEIHNRGHIEDVDGDGDDDMVLHFRTQETGIQCGDTQAGLTGMTVDGQEIEGADSIRTVGC